MKMLGSFLLLTAWLPTTLWAAAWTLPKDKWEYYLNAATYTADAYFDRGGVKQPQPRYTKYELNPYIEMGWREGTTLGATLALDAVQGTNLSAMQSGNNFGIVDPSIFLRQRLWQGERMVFSVQPLLKLPSYFVNETLPMSGSEKTDAELRMLGGTSFPLFGREHFANLELAYRKRFGAPADQLRMDATLGVAVADQWQILPQLSAIQSIGDVGAASFTQTPQDDFHLLKAQCSAVYRYTETLSVQAGFFSHLKGRNTGAGEGVLLSAWWRP